MAGAYVLLRDSGCTVISRRRLLTGFVLAWAPLGAAAAQEYKAGKVYRIGLINESSSPMGQGPFYERMRELGWVYGRDYLDERRIFGAVLVVSRVARSSPCPRTTRHSEGSSG
jgi:hypothetical protein